MAQHPRKRTVGPARAHRAFFSCGQLHRTIGGGSRHPHPPSSYRASFSMTAYSCALGLRNQARIEAPVRKGNSHEPKRDCGRIDAHRPCPPCESCAPAAKNYPRLRIKSPAINCAACLRAETFLRRYEEILRSDFAIPVDLVGQSGRHPHPPTPHAARITRAYKLRQQPVEPRQRELSGVSFCDGQDDFPELSRFCWSVCRASHTARIIELLDGNGWNH